METELLESLGLTKGEIAVYYSLLDLGSSTVGPIVSKSRISSSKIYGILDRLSKKGLVSYVIKENTKHFEAAPPSRILDYVNEKKEALRKQEEKLKKIIPSLEMRQKLVELKSQAYVFKGNKGFTTAFNDILSSLDKGDMLYVMGLYNFDDEFKRMIYHFHAERAKKGVKARFLMNANVEKINEKLATLTNTEIKYMPTGVTTPAIFLIYKDKVLLNIATERTFFRIENARNADAFRVYFESMWNQDTTIAKGMPALQETLYAMIDEMEPGQEYSVLGANLGVDSSKSTMIDFFEKFHKYRVKNNIRVKLLFYQNAIGTVAENQKRIDWQTYGQKKFLSYESELPIQLFTTPKKTIITTQDEDPTVITINNEKIAKHFQNHFESTWNQKVRILYGLDAVQIIFDEMAEAGHVDFIGARGYFMDARREYVEAWKKRAIKKRFLL